MEAGLKHLIRLQEADEQISRIRETIAALPKNLELAEEKHRSLRSATEQVDKSAKEEEARRRKLESDLKDLQQKLLKYREQSSAVKTNDQFHALQHEITFAENEIQKFEDQELASMERTEQLNIKSAEAKKALAAQAALVDQEKQMAQAASAEHEAKLQALHAERDHLRHKIDAAIFARYERIALARRTGLARVQGQRCMACQMYLRPQMWNQVRGGDLLACESCGRLMYYDISLEPPPVIPVVVEKPKKRKKKAEVAAPESVEEAQVEL
jgi:uncharacterized protein